MPIISLWSLSPNRYCIPASAVSCRRERLPVEIPAGISAEGVGLLPAAFSLGGVGGWGDIYIAAEMPYSFSPDGAAGKSSIARAMRRKMLGRVRYGYFEKIDLSSAIVVKEARILRTDGQILILEFEVPGMH